MSSKLSQMRAQFREKLSISPVNNSSVIVTKVSHLNNPNNKTIPINGTQKLNTTVNSRIYTTKKNISTIPINNENNYSISSSNARVRTNSTIPTINQKLTNTPIKNYIQSGSRIPPIVKNTSKTNTNNDNKLFSHKSRGLTEWPNTDAKKQTIPLQSRLRVKSPLKSSEKLSEPFRRKSSEGTPCRFCGRFFALSERLQRHEVVCESLKTLESKYKFDSTKQRFKGQPKEYLQLYEKSLETPREDVKNKSNWRTQHQYLMAAIQAAKGDTSSGPSTAQITASIQEPCNYCKRRFNEDALKRHIPICAKIYHKKVMNF